METELLEFTSRIARSERMIGSFVKSTSGQSVEVLASCGFDFLVLDAEHSPFDRGDIDRSILAAKAESVPVLVRVEDHRASVVLTALDCGAAGIVAPHVRRVEEARSLVVSTRYHNGGRGFTASSRAGGYGRATMADHIAQSDQRVALLAMIEDADAIGHAEAIARVEGVAGLFIGRADLAVSLGIGSVTDPRVRDATLAIAAAGRAAGKAVAVYVNTPAEIRDLEAMGASMFVMGSDQAFMRKAACDALQCAMKAS